MPHDRPFAGLFGKLPVTGDFVARGLPDAFRRAWDGWITAWIVPRDRAGARWPEGGLRFRLASGGRMAGGVILPSRDSVGRAYPLSLVLTADTLAGPQALDPWCDAAARLATGTTAADDLWQALDALPVAPAARAVPDEPRAALHLWTAGSAPLATEPADPDKALDLVLPFSSD